MTDPQKSRALIIAQQLDNAAEKFKEANPTLPSERVIRIAKQAINQNPRIAECTAPSVVNACMKAAADGLVCDGREAALVPYKDTAQYIIMYRGMLKLAYRTGLVSTVEVLPVYVNETFKFIAGDDARIEHEPIVFGDRGEVLGFYSIVRMRDGGVSREIMSKEDVDKIRGRARTKNPVWETDYIEMGKKTVLRRHFKRLPFESDLAAAFDDHQSFDDGYDPDPDAAPGEPEIQTPRKQRGAAAERLNPKAKPAPETVDEETGEITGGEEEEGRPLEMDTI